MVIYYQTSDQAVAGVLQRIAAAGRKQRLTNNVSQKGQAELAGISIKKNKIIVTLQGLHNTPKYRVLNG